MEKPHIASNNSDCFIIDESNQVKISREIMRCQGYFLKYEYINIYIYELKKDISEPITEISIIKKSVIQSRLDLNLVIILQS